MSLKIIEKGEVTYFQIYVSCPICLDKGITQPQQFITHANNNCNGDMYIGDNGHYCCSKCGSNSNILKWNLEGCDHINNIEIAQNIQLRELTNPNKEHMSLPIAMGIAGQLVQRTGIEWLQRYMRSVTVPSFHNEPMESIETNIKNINNMELKVKCFEENNNLGFPKFDMNVWIAESDKVALYGNREEPRGPQYVKIECKDVLSRFVAYAKLSTINNPNFNASESNSGLIWIPKEILHKSWLISPKTMVEVSLVDVDECVVADSVIIKLNPELVKYWSEDEISLAESNAKAYNRVAFDTQMLFIKPGTKKVIVGEVDCIYPKSTDRTTLYTIGSDTRINFTGLPLNRQKAIDFSQIGGLTEVINKLREIIQIPLNHPELLNRFGVKPPKGMLMYGPPGNGKTMIARAVAQSMGSTFITIEGPELMSKYVGVGEQRLREKFEEAESKGNCVIFIDEIDSITSKRSDSSAEYQVSIVATLLNLMDGMRSTNKVFVIGATNRLNAIDPALRRPGRFDLEFEVPLPNVSARYDILSKYIKLSESHLYQETVSADSIRILSELTNGYSGADISLLFRESVMNTVRKNISFDSETGKITLKETPENIRISNDDFFEALRVITPTSLRGIDVNKPSVQWENIIGLDNQKAQLEELYVNINKQLLSKNLVQRPSNLNLIIEGAKGAGKRTLMYAFAQQYNYEILELDLMDLESESIADAYTIIDQLIAKSKQIAPVILFCKNGDKVDGAEKYISKLLNDLYKLNKYLHVMAVMAVTDKSKLPENCLGYKAFDRCVDINQRIESIAQELSKLHNKNIESIIDGTISIGQAITKIQDEINICK